MFKSCDIHFEKEQIGRKRHYDQRNIKTWICILSGELNIYVIEIIVNLYNIKSKILEIIANI